MTQVLHCKVTRFLNGINRKNATVEAEAFLSALFMSLDVQNAMVLDIRCPVVEAISKISCRFAALIEPDWRISDLLTQIQEQDLTMKLCCGVRSFGVNFKIQQAANLSGCTLFYHPGPLPLIELGLLFSSDLQPPVKWTEKLLSAEAIHNVLMVTHWLRRCSYYGFGDNRYLMLKREKCLMGVKATEDATNAGLVLRDVCKHVWNGRRKDLAKLETAKLWPWTQNNLVRAFDNALVDEFGSQKFSELLNALGITVEQWFAS